VKKIKNNDKQNQKDKKYIYKKYRQKNIEKFEETFEPIK